MISKQSCSVSQKPEWPKGNVIVDSSSFKKEMLDAYGASKSLEAEYIRSLHKQIYLFELENKCLRNELGNSTAIQTKSKEKMKDKSVLAEMTCDERSTLANDLVKKCDEIENRLVREMYLRREQMDNFAQDILKLTEEKEAILKQNKVKDEVIEELNRNTNVWKNRVLDCEEKFEACKQALTCEIRRRKLLERKLEERNTDIYRNVECCNPTVDASPIPIPVRQSSSCSNDSKVDICKSISELSKLVIDQAEELRELKRVVYQIEMQKKLSKTINPAHLKTETEQSRVDHSSAVTAVRKRREGVDASKHVEERSVCEEQIRPIEKKKSLQFKSRDLFSAKRPP